MVTSNISSINEKSKPFYISRLFQDFDEWIEAFKNWDLSSVQLSSGKFKGELAIAQFSGVQFISASSSQAMQIIGGKLPNTFVFGISLASQKSEIVAHNQSLNQNTMFGLDPTRETYVVTRKACQIGIITVCKEVFYQYAERMKCQPFTDSFFQRNVISIDPFQLDSFKSYLRQIFHLLQINPFFLQQLSIQKLIIEDCLPLLINMLQGETTDPIARIAKLRRYPMIKAMENFMIENIEQPLTLKDLYTALETNSRSLSYGVQDLFGMSPMNYLKIRRLNGVRQMLKASHSKQITVSKIATNWGFWSMGHFSRDYKSLFGELPSETLKNI